MYGYSNKYQQNQILSATPEQILLMLYDGAIRFARQAKIASENGDLTTKLEKIGKVFAIITEFSNSLDHQVGGAIAADLDALYQFMLRELGKARKDTTGDHLQTVIGLLEDLRKTWEQAIEICKTEHAMISEKTAAAALGNEPAKPASINAAG